jgi:hypothetical protein
MTRRIRPHNDNDFGDDAKVLARRIARNSKNSKLLTAFELSENVFDAYKRVREWHASRNRWTVSVDSSDRLYDLVLAWFLETDETEPTRAVKALFPNAGMRNRVQRELFGEDDASAPQLQLFYDEEGSRVIDLAGHTVEVNLHRPNDAAPDPNATYRPAQPNRIFFYAKSQEGQQAVLDLLQELGQSQSKRKAAVHLLSSWGDWSRRDDLPIRQLDSVALAEGQMERLRDDLERFIAEEGDYARRGIPYHRGYVLYGPPGTGKTSIVRALAAHFQLDLYYAPLGDLEKDTSLIQLVNQVRSGSILLLEDIDVYHATRERDDAVKGASMAGLLNALDGVATPHGLITILTTNDIDVIDDALLRPGRIDVKEHIGLPDRNQIARLFNNWYEVELDQADIDKITFTDTTAAVTEVLKTHLNDSVAALAVLQQVAPIAEERSVTAIKEVNHGRQDAGRRVNGRVDKRDIRVKPGVPD